MDALRRLFVAFMVSSIPCIAWGQTISTLPAAGTPLAGTETTACVQGGLTKKCTVSSIAGTATLPTIAGNTFLGNPQSTSSIAVATPFPSCFGALNALIWTPGSGLGCNNFTGALTLNGTSATNVTIGTGTKTFTTQAGLLLQAGQFALISSAANSANYMHGTVTSYSGVTLVVNVLDVGGSGANADWNISISGPQGPQGTPGAGSINAGTSGQITYYAGAGTTVSGSSVIAVTANGITLGSGFVDNVRTITAAGAVTVLATDSVICINKASGAATTVNLPSSPATGLSYWIKDCKGDAATNNITVTPNAGNIDGASTFVIRVNRGSANIKYTGSEWSIF